MRVLAPLLLVLALGLTACPRDPEGPGTGSAPATASSAAAATAPLPAGGSSWTQAGGDGRRTAQSPEPGPRSVPGIAWTNPVAKEIVSEPVFGIAAGKPCVLIASGQEILAFDLESGKPAWSRALPSSVNASPLAAGGVVWAFAMDNMAFQLDAGDGRILKEIEQDFTLEASPLLHGDLVIFEETSLSAQSPESRLHAVDAATAAERWHYDFLRAGGRAPSSDGTRVFVAANDAVHAVSLADGAKSWTAMLPQLLVRTYSPVVAGDLVIASGGSYEPGYLLGLDAATGAVRWSVRTAHRIGAPPALAGSEILVPLMDGKIHRHSVTDGSETGTLDPGGRSDSRPVVSAERIYVPVAQTVVAFDRATFEEAWRVELESLEVSKAGIEHMAVMGTKLIVVRLDGHVHALEAPGGA